MRLRSALALAPLALLSLAAAAAFGPPRITVTEVTGTPPTPGAVLAITTEHHTDEEDADVSAQAHTMRNGERVTRAITIAKAGAKGRYGVTKQWEAGSPWVLVFTIKQGEHGAHGTAAAVLKVDATGKIVGNDALIDRVQDGHRIPRGASEADISRALRELGAR